MAPSADRNEAPETWITAAPQDTTTERDAFGTPRQTPVGTIPFKFHLYWAGSDDDGFVAGFYIAVTETTPVALPGFTDPPRLPGPRVGDYRFTTRTDSVIILTVSEETPDREHGIYIYAVDNLGKPDPTPAKVIVNALDRYPPLAEITRAQATGTLYRMTSDGDVDSVVRTYTISDSQSFDSIGKPPKDTVLAMSELTFAWRGEPTVAGNDIRGFRYKLDNPEFSGLVEDTSRVYPRGSVAAGSRLFTLRAVDQAGGARTTTRRFQVNFAPDTWFAGPEPSRFPLRPEGPGLASYRFIEVSDWGTPTTPMAPVAGTLISQDSLAILPALREPNRTFLEFYGNRIFLRTDGDTVHMNSWLVFHSGGSDVDSPYDVQVDLPEPGLADTINMTKPARVIRPGPPNGNPVGFIYTVAQELDPFLFPSRAFTSTNYPVFGAARDDRSPLIGGYYPAVRSGPTYVTIRAVDGNGAFDSRIENPLTFLRGPNGNGPLRSRVMAFTVGKTPYLLVGDPTFSPKPNATFLTRQIPLKLVARDDDPYDPDEGAVPGGPTLQEILRRSVTVKGVDADGDTVVYAPSIVQGFYDEGTSRQLQVPSGIVGTEVVVEVELCDCRGCETEYGTGRCMKYVTKVTIPPSEAGTISTAERRDRPGPGDGRGGTSR